MGEIILIVLLVGSGGYWLWRLLQKKEKYNEDKDVAI